MTSAPNIKQVFESMEYGPAPESASVANDWLEDHKRNFGLFINNKWHHPAERKTYATKNPATGEVLAQTMQGTQDDVNLAVSSSRKAYETWSKLSPDARARHLYSIARHVQKHARLFAVIESMDNGKTIRETRDADIPLVIRHLYYYAGWSALADKEMSEWTSVGVVGGIVPWNFPLMLMCWKVAPALAMGNTVVLKPATYTRLSALLFAEICSEAGLPPGVFNVITGDGRMGSMLATHPDVDKVGFTGSTNVGQLLRRATAGSGKKLSLELGGKSPFVVFDSADIDSAVEGVVDAIWFNQGQVCSAGSRLIVQDTVLDRMMHKMKERLKHFRVGDSLDKCMDMGALVDTSQMKTITEYVESARAENADIYQAFECFPTKSGDGRYFYPPTIISRVQTVSRVVQEEIFGPVLVVLPFRTAKESVSLANNTLYGLGASVWSEKHSLALEVALLIKAGAVWINAHNLFDAAAGFGGYKHSGYGRDGGKEGLFEYVKPKWQQGLIKPPYKQPVANVDKFGENPNQGRPDISQPENADPSSTPRIDRTYKFYYGGKQARPDAPYSRSIHSQIDKNMLLGQVGEGNRKDVRNAVAAAHAARDNWGKRAAFNRSQIIYYLAENLELRRAEFTDKLRHMTGCSESAAAEEVEQSVRRLFYWAAYADKFGGDVQETPLYGATVKVNEPVGVIGIACPDENPLLSFVSLLAPAVVRSNVVVVVPSEKYPLAALDFYQVFETSDIPGGVINVLTGSRDHLTRYLTQHQDVQAMWYFGSAEGSQFVETASADNLKRTWCNYGRRRNWADSVQGQGEEFLYHAVQVKNIWIPMGDIFAN